MYVRVFFFGTVLSMSGCLIGSGELTVEQADELVVITTDDPAPAGGPSSSTSPPPATTAPISDPNCGAGQAQCDGICIGVAENDANCGACGNQCDAGRVCMNSACECEIGEFCGNQCVDVSSTAAHCGACNRVCGGGESCVAGDCVALGEVERVLAATNAARASGANCGFRGSFGPAPALQGDPNLHMAAQVLADDMAANNFFSHTGSDGSDFVERVRRTPFAGQPVAENIAAGNQTAQGTVQQWLNSDGHCANMMNPNATKLGVGYAAGGPYGTTWVQVFGR